MEPMRVAAVSMMNWIGQQDRSMDRVRHWARCASEQGAQFVLFPELNISGYFHDEQNAWQLAEPIPGPSVDKLIRVAAETGAILCCGLLEKEADLVYNTQVIVSGDGLLGKQRKTHMPGPECFFWRPGTALTPINIGKAVVGIANCFDAQFPEVIRTLYFKGAEIVVMPFAYMTGPRETLPETDVWCMGWRYNCAQNACFGLVANSAHTPGRTDHTEGMVVDFPGWAGVIGPFGELLAWTRQPDADEAMVLADLDPNELEKWRFNKYFKVRCLNPTVYLSPAEFDGRTRSNQPPQSHHGEER